MRKRVCLIGLFLIFFSLKNYATHIVGGEIYYDCLGGNDYQITLKVYRDCYTGVPPFDNPAYIGIYDVNGNLLQTVNMGIADSSSIPANINNPCFTPPTDVCVREGVYTKTINLPPINGGYVISYQRCCRNSAILNIVNASLVGSTYEARLLDSSVVSCNSSPRYSNFPPLFLCSGVPLNFDHAATDPDGDSLYYELCDAFTGASDSNPMPVPPSSPPYAFVSYVPPYSGTFPINSSPAITINAQTGIITGTPNMIGRWVVGVCVSEYRNGVFLTTNKRDFQFNVVNCPNLPVASIPEQQTFCFGNQIQFSQNSNNAFSYEWNFGDPSTTLDVSNTASPTWTYAASGTYSVTLIINPGTLCSDTNTTTFYIFPLLAPTFVSPPGECAEDNSFDFSAAGAFMGNGSFNWDFGTHASPAITSQQNPTNIIFDSAGDYPVTLTVNENGCSKTYTSTISVYPKPVANFGLTSNKSCVLNPVLFSDSSSSDTPLSYFWTFGNGKNSTDQNPATLYAAPGTYPVNLFITSQHGCKDSMELSSQLSVYELPVAQFSITPKDTSIFYPEINMTDESSGAIACTVYWGDGSSTLNCDSIHSYAKPGTYKIIQVVVNLAGCYDTAYHDVIIRPEFLFWIPNAFTPNDNGLNDVFKPEIMGVHDYKFLIFDRWGEKIVESTTIEEGWNGTYKNKLCSNDVYVYKISFRDDVQNSFHQYTGRVTLVR